MSTISAGNTVTTGFVVSSDATGNLVFVTGGANTVALTIDNAQAATFAGNANLTGTSFGFGRLANLTVFTSSGTWTKPVNCSGVVVEVLGGGGGGGGGSGADQGAGGSAGGYCREYISAASLANASYTVTVGAAGTAGSGGGGNGGAGGNSSFDSFCTGAGGGAGGGGLGGPAAGGTATGGDINIAGQQGGGRIGGAKGGDSPLGTGGTSNDFTVDSSGYGAGGCGANGNRAGKAGTAGIVIVWELR